MDAGTKPLSLAQRFQAVAAEYMASIDPDATEAEFAFKSADGRRSVIAINIVKPESKLLDKTHRGTLTSNTPLRPEPLASAAASVSRSSPAFSPAASASPARARCAAHRALLRILTTLPQPGPPHRTVSRPKMSNNGFGCMKSK